MNKLITLFFAFTMAIFMSATAVAARGLQGSDLENFFNFDLDRSWSYSAYVSAETAIVENMNINVTSGKCYENADCVKHYYPDFAAKIRLKYNGDVVAYKIDDEYIDEVILLSNKPVSQVVPEVAFPVFGIYWVEAVHDVSAVNMSCNTDLISGVKFKGKNTDVLIQKCEFSFTDQWGAQTINMSRYYFDRIGLVQSVVVYNSYDNEIVPVQLDEENFLENFSFNGEKNVDPSVAGDYFYSDVTVSHKNYEAIVFMFERGIMNGYQDGTFGASKRINRAELLKVLVEATGPTPSVSEYHGCFADAVGEWYEAYACYAKELGWIAGYPNGKLQGSDPVNKVEAIKMILNAFDVELLKNVDVKPFDDVELGSWYVPYVATAKDMGLLEMDKFYVFDKRADMRRGEVAETLYRLMTR